MHQVPRNDSHRLAAALPLAAKLRQSIIKAPRPLGCVPNDPLNYSSTCDEKLLLQIVKLADNTNVQFQSIEGALLDGALVDSADFGKSD